MLNICLFLNANTYLSPINAQNYLDKTKIFRENNVSLEYFNFTHPKYPQLKNDFEPFISGIDLIFNCGEKSSDYVKCKK